MSRTAPVWRGALAAFGVRLVFVLVLGALLTGCGAPEGEGAGDAPNATARSDEGASGASPAPSKVAESAAAAIDEALIREDLAHLTGASPAPLARGPTTISNRGGENGRRAAAEYMKESFEAVGIPARILEFAHNGKRGFNVEATLEGTLVGTEGEKHLWLTAHLDSVYNPGADDDASGLVSILSSARALQGLGPEHTIHFVAYDLEEDYLVGSSFYVGSVVSAIREEEGEGAIIGNLQSDMVGYDGEGQLDATMETCGRAGPINEAILRASEVTEPPITLIEECDIPSDHVHFWDAGLPAVLLIDDTKRSYPWYHEPGDTVDKLDLPYLRSMVQLAAAAAALLTVAPESEADVEPVVPLCGTSGELQRPPCPAS